MGSHEHENEYTDSFVGALELVWGDGCMSPGGKDAMIHIEDKHALFKEVFRVLRPGGLFVASDWMCRDEQAPGPVMQHWIDTVGLSFGLHSPPYYIDALEQAGFLDIETTDRNEFVCKALKADYDLMAGEEHEELIRRTGDEATQYIEIWHAGWKAAECGELRPGHLRGLKPSS